MILTFYNCSSPTIKLNKTLGNALKTTNATPNPTGDIDILNPVFLVDDTQVPSNANYVVAGAPLNRSYFITSITYGIGKSAAVACHCDVLSTYSAKFTDANLNFISGAEDINMVEDNTYPLTDLYVHPIIHYNFPNWDSNNFANSGVGKHFILRTVTSKARSVNVRDFNIGDEFIYLGKYLYEIIGTADDAECRYINETTNSYPIVRQNDIVKIGTYEYIFKAPEYNTGRLDPLD